MTDYRPLYIVVGVMFLSALLLSPVGSFSPQGVNFIDTELRGDSTTKRFVETKYPIGDVEKLSQFPTEFGPWRMSHQYEWDNIAELLGTDILLSRNYDAPGVYVPVSLLIVQSTNVSSFHPAPVCYKFQGFSTVDDYTDTVEVPITNATWAREPWLDPEEARVFQGHIEVKRLLVEKERRSGQLMRELNLYFYIKEEHKLVTDRIAWVRVSMYVPASGDYSAHEELLKNFTAAIVPELFDPAKSPEPKLLVERLYEKVARRDEA